MASPSLSKAEQLALHQIDTSKNPQSISPSHLAQVTHRLQLVSYWAIAPGSRILELGCGQGDCTVVLADAVGENGHVDAVDPGSPDYGSPFTLAQAQAYIKHSPLGPLITFHSQDPLAYLASYTGPPYDYIVLAHCIYYFSTPAILPALLSALAPHAKTLCLAEWSLHASSLAQVPHVLTALLLSSLETKRAEESRGNIRTVLSPAQISAAVLSTTTPSSSTSASPSSSQAQSQVSSKAFQLHKSAIQPSTPGLLDAYWEIRDLLRKQDGEVRGARERGLGEGEAVVWEAAYAAVRGMVEGLEGGVEGVRCMDFWVGVWGRGEE